MLKKKKMLARQGKGSDAIHSQPSLVIAALVQGKNSRLLEWLAYHRYLGVDHFLLADLGCSGDCRTMLEALAERGVLTLVRGSEIVRLEPQESYQSLVALAEKRGDDAVALLDVGEYIHPMSGVRGAGQIIPWLQARFIDPEMGAIALNRAAFARPDHSLESDELVIKQFSQRAPRQFAGNCGVVSILRPGCVSGFLSPRYVTLAEGYRYVDAEGAQLEEALADDGSPLLGVSRNCCWKFMRINAYPILGLDGSEPKEDDTQVPGNQPLERLWPGPSDANQLCRKAWRFAAGTQEEIQRLTVLLAAPAVGNPNSSLWVRILRGLGQSTTSTLPLVHWTFGLASGPDDSGHSGKARAGQSVHGEVVFKPEHQEALSRSSIVAEWASGYRLCLPLIHSDLLQSDARRKGVDDQAPESLCCSMQFSIPWGADKLTLWLTVGNQCWQLDSLKLPENNPQSDAVKAVVGRKGWLFLDNDTNISIDQYRGMLSLSGVRLEEWRQYLTGFNILNAEAGRQAALLVAPTKESVLGRYHPEKKLSISPAEHIMMLCSDAPWVHPVSQLRALGDDAFIKTDTHWTQSGAATASIALGVRLGFRKRTLEKLFADDEYQLRAMTGDLGNKFDPVRSCQVKMLTSFSHGPYKRFDNGLPNFGRILVVEYPEALSKKTCLLFGSSSSYSMLNFMCRLYQRLIVIHTAGNIDPAVVQAVEPDAVVVQTNARFMVQVPALNYSLKEVIEDKLSRLTEDQVQQVHQLHRQAPPDQLELWGLDRWTVF